MIYNHFFNNLNNIFEGKKGKETQKRTQKTEWIVELRCTPAYQDK